MLSIFRNRWISLVLLAAALLLIFNPYTKFPYTFIVIILYILGITFLQDGHFKSLNFKRIGLKEIKVILLCYLILELSVDFIFDPMIEWISGEKADYSVFSKIQGNSSLYFEWLIKMWISAAIGEELLFRAFTFSQLRRGFGDNKYVLVLTSAILFALPHFYQGISGVISTFIFGIAFAIIYLRFKNIWINIIVHGMIDTLFLTLSYYGWMEFYELGW